MEQWSLVSWLRESADPCSICPLSSTEFVEPPPNKIPGYATASDSTNGNETIKTLTRESHTMSQLVETVRYSTAIYKNLPHT